MFIVPISQMSSFAELQKQTSDIQPTASTNMPFEDVLKDTVKTMQETQQVSRQDAYDLSMGQSDDLHSVMIHSAQASTALKLTVELTTRAVNAYKEIMQVQI